MSPSPSPPPDFSHDADDKDGFSVSASRVGDEYQATLPRHGALVSTDRGDKLISIAETEAEVATECARRLTTSINDDPSCPVLKLARRDRGIKAQQPKVPRPRCGTWGCTLPDRHSGLHQVRDAAKPTHTARSARLAVSQFASISTKRRVCTPKRHDDEAAPPSENYAALVGVSKRCTGGTARQPLGKATAPLFHCQGCLPLALVLSN